VYRKANIVAVVAVGLMALARAHGQENAPQSRAEETTDRLRQVVQTAARGHQAYCNQFLAAALDAYLGEGVTYNPGGSIKNLYSGIDLDETMTADAQIDYMRAHWERVDLHRAMQLANQGKLVVAGMKSQPGLRNPPGYDQHGHVGVVMPGGPHPQTRWPVVAGGGSAAARSVEGKAMNYVWNPYFLHPRLMVEFFTPRSTPQIVTVDVKPYPREQPIAKADTKTFTYDNSTKKVMEGEWTVTDVTHPARPSTSKAKLLTNGTVDYGIGYDGTRHTGTWIRNGNNVEFALTSNGQAWKYHGTIEKEGQMTVRGASYGNRAIVEKWVKD